MNNYKYQLFILYLIISLIDNAYAASRTSAAGTKFGDLEYINLFKIPSDYISSIESPGSSTAAIKKALDENPDTYWLSPEVGTKVRDPQTGTTYNPLQTLEVTVTFTKKVFIKSFIYQAWSLGSIQGIGYPDELNVYYALGNDNFILADNIRSYVTGDKVAFTFLKIIECTKIRLEWKKIHESTTYNKKASAKIITFLYPETDYLSHAIVYAFDKSDYKQMTLSSSYKNFKKAEELTKGLKQYGYNEDMNDHVNRIVSIINGALKYDPRREFSTRTDDGMVHILQRGDIENHARQYLKMKWVGTNRQSMGIYGRAKEKLTIYVKAEKSTDPLPKIICTQYIGGYYGWLSNANTLKVGKQTISVDDFKLADNLQVPTYPGGPLYVVNPYEYKEQGEVNIYIEGGEVFPTYRIGENFDEYKEKLLKCIELNKLDPTKYFDITELIGIREMITVKASTAYDMYTRKGSITPDLNLRRWDNFLKTLFIFDGVQFGPDQQYYHKLNRYINIHFRYSQPYGGGYAYYQHVGIFGEDWIEKGLNFDMNEIGWGFVHETGHMMEITEREYTEISNNVLSKYYDSFLSGANNWGLDLQKYKIQYLTKDEDDNKLRGCDLYNNNENCQGFLKNTKWNYLIWWDLESIHHGYWGKLENMYRYNNTFPSGITREEKLVYFSSIIFKMDLSYYFSRWGLTFHNSNNVFDEKSTSADFRTLMNALITEGKIDMRAPQKKFWYLDNAHYNLNNNVKGCYADQNRYIIDIPKIIKQENKYILTLPDTGCPDHLGFEIYETYKLIGFTYDHTFTDETKYDADYLPKYRIKAFDRKLETSRISNYRSYTNSIEIKLMNINNHLFDQ